MYLDNRDGESSLNNHQHGLCLSGFVFLEIQGMTSEHKLSREIVHGVLKEATKGGHHGGPNIHSAPNPALCHPTLCQGYTGSRGKSLDIFIKGSCKRSPSLFI